MEGEFDKRVGRLKEHWPCVPMPFFSIHTSAWATSWANWNEAADSAGVPAGGTMST